MELGKYFRKPQKNKLRKQYILYLKTGIRRLRSKLRSTSHRNDDICKFSTKSWLSILCRHLFLMEFQSLEQIKDLWLRCWPLLYLISNWSYVEKVNKCLRNLNNLQNLNISLNKTLYNQYNQIQAEQIYRNTFENTFCEPKKIKHKDRCT